VVVRPRQIIAQVKTRPLCLWSRPPLATESSMVPATMLTMAAAKWMARDTQTVPDDVAKVTRSMPTALGILCDIGRRGGGRQFDASGRSCPAPFRWTAGFYVQIDTGIPGALEGSRRWSHPTSA